MSKKNCESIFRKLRIYCRLLFVRIQKGGDKQMDFIAIELFSVEFFSALLTIVFIDLILAGDNAIVSGWQLAIYLSISRKKPLFGVR